MSTDAVVTFKDGDNEDMFEIYISHSCDPETMLNQIWDAVHFIDKGAAYVGRLNWDYFAMKIVCSLTSYFDKVCIVAAGVVPCNNIYDYTITPIKGKYEDKELYIPLCLQLRCEYSSGELVYDDVLDNLA